MQCSSLQMTHGGSDATTVTVTADVPSDIVCKAVAGRPVVTIDWYHKTTSGSETKITEGVSQIEEVNAGDPDTFDVTSTLSYTVSKDYNGGLLRCVTTGQYNDATISIEDTATLTVQCKSLPKLHF